MNQADQPLSYRDAGVDIDAGNELVERIKPLAKKTFRPEVRGNLGGFGALCELPSNYKKPLLVSGTDGVGTKLKLAIESGCHDTVGIDLVAMCVNDLLATGAEPLFFLDYYATASLDVDVAASVVKGIAEGCEQAGAALIGGETAEMPGMYQQGDYDLAGFCVGVVEESEVITQDKIKPGQHLLALASSGPHSNGYSLIRKVLELAELTVSEREVRVEKLMVPTRIYVKSVLELAKKLSVNGVAHITGGGLTENIPRILPAGTAANIDLSSWELPETFQWLRSTGNILEAEMLRAFNCGVGMVVSVPAKDAEEAIKLLQSMGEKAWQIGEVIESNDQEPEVRYSGELF